MSRVSEKTGENAMKIQIWKNGISIVIAELPDTKENYKILEDIFKANLNLDEEMKE